MRGIDELDHYELLEVKRGASQQEVDRAYRTAQQIYADGSLALYSVFENVDAAAIRLCLDDAYRVLSDPELRGKYDDDLDIEDSHVVREDVAGLGGYAEPVGSLNQLLGGADRYTGVTQTPLFGGNAVEDTPEDPEHRMDAYRVIDSVEGAVEEFDAIEDDVRGEFDGVRLRRTRMFRGYEIDDISEVTKVSRSHLRNIEAENFEDLPADVYVRGFVTAYAQTIGLDPKIVVPSYMARVEQSRGNPHRVRFLASR